MHKRMSPHGDYDHLGEAVNLINNFKVDKVILNNDKFNDLETELINVLNDRNINYFKNVKQLSIFNNKLYFLNDELYSNENDNSIVLYVVINDVKMLFMADAGISVEHDIIKKYNLNDIDILKVGHHGSKTSTSRKLIDVITPQYALISVGKNNRYGHPDKQVLNRLKQSKIYRTDEHGSVVFKFKNHKLDIESYLS